MSSCYAGFNFPLSAKHRSKSFKKLESVSQNDCSIELLMPPTGEVYIIESLAAKKEKGRVPFYASIGIQSEAGALPGRSYLERMEFKKMHYGSILGKISLQHVGLGLDLRVLAVFEKSWEPVCKNFKGPSVKGEAVFVRLARPKPDREFKARLVNSCGKPIPDTEFVLYGGTRSNLRYEPNSFCEMLGRCDTDDKGIATVKLPPSFKQWSITQIKLVPKMHIQERFPPFGVFDLPETGLLPEVLSTITVKRAPLLLAGVVVDTFGNPVPDAEIIVNARSEIKRNEGWVKCISYSYEVFTSPEGKWAIWGYYPSSRFRIRAYKRGMGFSSWIEAFAGSKDVLLRIEQGCGVLCQIKVDKASYIDDGLCSFKFMPTESKPGREMPPIKKKVLRDGQVLFTGLFPGLYDLEVWVFNDDGTPLYKVNNFNVHHAEPESYSTKLEIDLRGLADEVVLRARTPRNVIIDPRLLLVSGGHGWTVDAASRSIRFLKEIGSEPRINIRNLKTHKSKVVAVNGNDISVNFQSN